MSASSLSIQVHDFLSSVLQWVNHKPDLTQAAKMRAYLRSKEYEALECDVQIRVYIEDYIAVLNDFKSKLQNMIPTLSDQNDLATANTILFAVNTLIIQCEELKEIGMDFVKFIRSEINHINSWCLAIEKTPANFFEVGAYLEANKILLPLTDDLKKAFSFFNANLFYVKPVVNPSSVIQPSGGGSPVATISPIITGGGSAAYSSTPITASAPTPSYTSPSPYNFAIGSIADGGLTPGGTTDDNYPFKTLASQFLSASFTDDMLWAIKSTDGVNIDLGISRPLSLLKEFVSEPKYYVIKFPGGGTYTTTDLMNYTLKKLLDLNSLKILQAQINKIDPSNYKEILWSLQTVAGMTRTAGIIGSDSQGNTFVINTLYKLSFDRLYNNSYFYQKNIGPIPGVVYDEVFPAYKNEFDAYTNANNQRLQSQAGQLLYRHVLNSIAARLDSNAEDIILLCQGGMDSLSQLADTLSKELTEEREKSTEEKKAAFQIFMNKEVEIETEFYQTEMKQAQDHYNDLQSQYNDMVKHAQDLQTQITRNIQALGPVLGYYAYKNNISSEQMKDLGVLKQAVAGIAHANETYNQGTKEEGYPAFWNPQDGHSGTYANRCLSEFQELDTLVQNFDLNKRQIQDQMKETYAGMLALQKAWKKTVDKINSVQYVQHAIKVFNTQPENALLNKEVQEITLPLNEITSFVQERSDALADLLDHIEIYAITMAGMIVPDFSSYPFLKKKQIWLGCEDYLKKNLKRVPEIEKIIHDYSSQKNFTDEDNQHLALAKQCIIQIMMAQLLERRLSQDYEFQLQLKMEEETNSKTGVDVSRLTHRVKITKEQALKNLEKRSIKNDVATAKSKKHSPLLYAGAGVALLALIAKTEKRN